MPYLKLVNNQTGTEHEFESDEVRLGRDPALEFVIEGEPAKVVSGLHLRFYFEDGNWWVEDKGSRNGTYLNEEQLQPNSPRKLRKDQVVGLARRGPRLRVAAVVKRVVDDTLADDEPTVSPLAATMPMSAVSPEDATVPMKGIEDVPEAESDTSAEGEEASQAGAESGSGPESKTEPSPVSRPESPPPPKHAPEPEAPPRQEPQPSKPKEPAKPPPAPPPEPGPTPPSKPAESSKLRIVLSQTGQDARLELTQGRIRLGRGQECEVRPIGVADTSISRVHAEIVLKPQGTWVVRDARSRNGTLVNGRMLSAEHQLSLGDTIKLGDAGPEYLVEELVTSAPEDRPVPEEASPSPAEPASSGSGRAARKARAAAGAERRSFGGKGATMFFKELVAETHQKSARKIRVLVWSFVGIMAVGVGGVYWYSETRVRETAQALEEQRQVLEEQARMLEVARAEADSLNRAAAEERDRLSTELENARSASAPAAVLDSLRTALSEAQSRTAALEAALERAQSSISDQLALGDSLRAEAEADVARLRSELASARGGDASGLLDSLRNAIRTAEQKATELNSQMSAVRAADLAAVAQANQSAVGLVTTYASSGIYDGSGFAVTPDGYFVTNRHVVRPGGAAGDSVFVTMADQRTRRKARVVSVTSSSGPDVAVLKIEEYRGPYMRKVDWKVQNVNQGEPAALIGFPTGEALAMDRTRTVRTSMSAGIFSKVTEDLIQFDGFTVGGSSGSPIFNSLGEVVAVHRAGLREATGLSLAVPITKVVPLLPPDAGVDVDRT